MNMHNWIEVSRDAGVEVRRSAEVEEAEEWYERIRVLKVNIARAEHEWKEKEKAEEAKRVEEELAREREREIEEERRKEEEKKRETTLETERASGEPEVVREVEIEDAEMAADELESPKGVSDGGGAEAGEEESVVSGVAQEQRFIEAATGRWVRRGADKMSRYEDSVSELINIFSSHLDRNPTRASRSDERSRATSVSSGESAAQASRADPATAVLASNAVVRPGRRESRRRRRWQ